MKKIVVFIVLCLLLLGACQAPGGNDAPPSDLPPDNTATVDSPGTSAAPQSPDTDIPAASDEQTPPTEEKPKPTAQQPNTQPTTTDKPVETPAKTEENKPQPAPPAKTTPPAKAETPAKPTPPAEPPATNAPGKEPAPAPSPKPQPAPEPEKPAQSVQISITGHENAFAYSGSIAIQDGDTVADVLLRFCAQENIDYKTRGKGKNLYVVSIGGQKEFDFGALSGWQYSVNSVHASYGCGNVHVKNGDIIAWQYKTEL